ncbi:MAG: hypothetical protein RLY57_247 [Candidatus Parcubacteria bacterium]|jgi:murein DD-endopeptidase MepM/ murein hydrolase activator NlpD
MKKLLLIIPIAAVLIYFFTYSNTEARVTLTHSPDQVIQGEPIQITLKGTKKRDNVSVTFGDTSVPMSMYDKKLVGFVPTSITKPVGDYTVTATVGSKTLTDTISVITREKYVAPLGIPQTLGGNTAKSQKQLVDTLALDNQSLLGLGTESSALWKKAFAYPVADPIVTDPYGYSRQTGAYSITHKGTDFRAPVGTEVLAVNDGVVKLAQYGRNYGNTIVIDHGNGVQSFYMHLSRSDVVVGDEVERGDVIGLSGQTGYAEGPHLHFTLRINDVSIDPMVFFGFFQ